jgi:hypothetical protein
MSKIDDGGAAFAGMAADGHPDYRAGLTKREYFAAAALTGLLAANATYNGSTSARALLAQDALGHADALIAASKLGGADA